MDFGCFCWISGAFVGFWGLLLDFGAFCWILGAFVGFWRLLLKPCFCFDVWQLFNQLVGSFGRHFSLGSDPVCSVYFTLYIPVLVISHLQFVFTIKLRRLPYQNWGLDWLPYIVDLQPLKPIILRARSYPSPLH